MKKTMLGWATIVLTVSVLFALDYVLRTGDGNIHTGGLKEGLFITAFTAGVLVTVGLWWRGTKSLSLILRVVLVLLQAYLGFVLYFLSALNYVCSTGIDCI
jgi:hypothetical protein